MRATVGFFFAFALVLIFGPAAPALAQQPIRIGLNTSITGTGAEAGQYEANGARLALEEVNKAGGVLGRPLQLAIEDNQTTNPGVVSAFTKLVSDSAMVAVVGPSRSTQINAVLPNIDKAGLPVMIGGSDPTLTRQGNRWVFRFRPTDRYGARVMADFGVNTLKLKKWAVVHSTDTFGVSGMTNLLANLKELGVTPVLVQGYTNKAPDFTPVVLAIKQSGAELIASYFTFSEDVGIFAKQLRQLGVDAPWVGSTSIVTYTAMKLAGPALNATYAVTDFASESSPEAKAYAGKYEAAHKIPADLYAAWTYDAVRVLAQAMNKAKSTGADAIRRAILNTNGYRGVLGTYRFEANGDSLHGFNVVTIDNGKIVFIKHIQLEN